MFTKLYSSLCLSSVWSEDPPTRILWITLLASADRKGFVYGSPVGLAAVARLPLDDVKASLEKLASPDPESSDLQMNPDNEGRRIRPIDGGWLIINYVRYRDIRDADARREQNREAQARFRAKRKTSPRPVSTRKPR